MSWALILLAMKLDNTFADQTDRWHRAVWMAAKTTTMGFNSAVYTALWVLSKRPRWCSPHRRARAPYRMCMLAAHVAQRHQIGPGRQIGLFWVETSSQLFQQHMFRYLACPRVGFACCISLVRGRNLIQAVLGVHSFHHHRTEHPNGLLHCSALTRFTQERVGGDVPLVFQPPNGPVERVHFCLVNT